MNEINSFFKYPSIENHYNISKVKFTDVEGTQWVVTEKLHGANYALYTNGKEVRAAKRSGFVGRDENFYNHQLVYDKFQSKVLDLFELLNESSDKKLEIVAVHGELFGGNSMKDHVSKFKPIQKGVFYTTGIEFLGFDVSVIDEDDRHHMLNFDGRVSSFRSVGIPHAPVLYIGSLDECVNFCERNKTMNSLVPFLYGFGATPEDEISNVVEGFVLKPTETVFDVYGHPVAFKYKTEHFLEKSRDAAGKRSKATGLSSKNQKIYESVMDYINDNRIESYQSKVGTIKRDELGKHIKGIIDDALEDFEKDGNEIEDRKLIAKLVSRHVAQKLLKIAEI